MSEPLLELRGVRKRYDHDVLALDRVDLRIEAGEAVAIVGRSGSGKSTLLAMLGLLDAPSEGEVRVDGEPIDVSSDPERSRHRAHDLGFVFQRAHLLGGLTSIENVELSLRYAAASESDIAERARAALEEVDLDHRVSALARTLSGGEMQRVAIARALAKDARLWLADEPTGNLDSAQSAEIIELMRRRARARGAALVVVTHEPDIAALFERVITLSDGRVVSDERRMPAGLPDHDTAPSTGQNALTLGRRSSTGILSLVARTVRFSGQSLLSSPRKAWAAIAATATAVALIIVALGLAQSARTQVTEHFDQRRARQVSATVSFDGDDPRIDDLTIGPVRSYPGVEAAELRTLWSNMEMRNGEIAATEALLIRTDGHSFEATSTRIEWAPGRDGIGAGEVVLGDLLAKRLHVSQIELMPEIVIGGSTFRVVGVVAASEIASTAGAALVTELPKVGWEPSYQAEVHIDTQPGAARAVAERLPLLVDPYEHGRTSVDPVLRPDDHRDQLEDDVAVSLGLLAVIASLAGLLAVVALNLMDVTSRRAEMGVRRAFGARRSELVALVAVESLATGLVGAILGITTGFCAVMAVSAIARWHPVFDPSLVLVGAGAAAVFGLLGGIAPAIAAGRVHPADAVRD